MMLHLPVETAGDKHTVTYGMFAYGICNCMSVVGGYVNTTPVIGVMTLIT